MAFSYLYLHIPFCLSKCNYCDFLSFAGSSSADRAQYADLLLRELQYWLDRGAIQELKTVYFGGGTPSLMAAEDMGKILAKLPLAKNAEITLEANPATVDLPQLRALRQTGFNRISIGGQSFDEVLLTSMGRIHNKKDCLETVQFARQAGFTNINLDLMYGLPGQTGTSWRQTLQEAVALAPEHISVYGLRLEEDTPWGMAYAAGQLALPAEEDVLLFWQMVREFLPQHGYENYEIANFAKSGYACRHNLAYWHREDYLGLGLAAASCQKETRWVNTNSLEAYRIALAAGEKPPHEEETLTCEQVLAEKIFLGLRLKEGVCLTKLPREFDLDVRRHFAAQTEPLFANGLLIEQDGYWRLTAGGMLLANEVFSAFLP